MLYPPVADLLKNVDSRYLLVNVVAQRARQIAADAEAYAITAKAAAEAEANQKVAESLTDELIEYTQAQLWDGKLPTTYVGSSDSLHVLNIGAQEATEAE